MAGCGIYWPHSSNPVSKSSYCCEQPSTDVGSPGHLELRTFHYEHVLIDVTRVHLLFYVTKQPYASGLRLQTSEPHTWVALLTESECTAFADSCCSGACVIFLLPQHGPWLWSHLSFVAESGLDSIAQIYSFSSLNLSSCSKVQPFPALIPLCIKLLTSQLLKKK